MEQRETNNAFEVNLREVMGVLLRKAWIIILAGVLLATGAFLATKYYITPMYESTTQIYVMSKQDNLAVVTYNDLQTGSQLTNDYMTLIMSRPVTETVIEDLGLKLGHNEMLDMMTVRNPTNTRVLIITIKYSDPIMAKQIADGIREAAAIHIRNVMDIEQVSVVEEANIPEGPSSPSMKRNILLGGMIGVVFAGFVILLLYMLDDTIKTPEDIEKYLNLSVLGSIPMQKHLREVQQRERKPKKNKKFKEVTNG